MIPIVIGTGSLIKLKKMKNKITISLLVLTFVIFNSFGQEGTKFPFNSGVLKICSSKNFIIKGYDGKEVIIKNLSPDNSNYALSRINRKHTRRITRSNRVSHRYNTDVPFGKADSLKVQNIFFFNQDEERSEGLKKLGKKATAHENGIYLQIEQRGNELIISDDTDNMFVMVNNEKYEITIPNSLALKWSTNECNSKNRPYFFSSNSSELIDFKGEVEITFTMNNIILKDVSGPVTVSTIGGNVTVEFNNTKPKKLYSIYSNNGFIDMKLPARSSVNIDASGEEILSDLDFDIVSEKEINGAQQMNLKLGSGQVKMKLNAGYGNIYLRKN